MYKSVHFANKRCRYTSTEAACLLKADNNNSMKKALVNSTGMHHHKNTDLK